jgi:hypothetical protein
MNAEDILLRLRKTYASAHAYRDLGRVIMLGNDDVHGEAIGTFRTAFERSGRLQFEFQIPGKKTFVLRAKGTKVIDFRGSVRSQHEHGLDGAIGTLTGVTFGAAHTVPRLLVPSAISGRALGSGAIGRHLRDESVEGEICRVIDLSSRGHREEIAVSYHAFTLRRILFHPVVTEDVATVARAKGLDVSGHVMPRFVTYYTPDIWLDEPTGLDFGGWLTTPQEQQ